MASYLPSDSDEKNSDLRYLVPLLQDDESINEGNSDELESIDYDTPINQRDVTEDLSLVQIFLPRYSEKDMIAAIPTQIACEDNGITGEGTVSQNTFLDSYFEYFTLKLKESPNSPYFKICMEILTGEFTEEQFILNCPRYYQCESTFISKTFSSHSHFTSVREYLNWVSSNKMVKGNCNAVPYGILPKGISSEITDVKINCYGIDDKMYANNQVLRERVARGNSFVTFFGKDVPNGGCVVRGLKKFSGAYWDDDDIQHTDHAGWSKYFLAAPANATNVVVMEKVNGEAAHVSVRLLGTKFLIFCGSKNVHLLVTQRQHLLKYKGQRYSYACLIGEAFFDLLEGINESQRVRLLSFLAHTGFTAIFELLQPQNQHIVNLSHLPVPILKFITWVPCDMGGKNCICSLPPSIAIDLASYLCLPTANYSLIEIAELPRELAAVRSSTQCEGVVLYFLNGNQEVIGLIKFKSIWYILLRAVREILKFQISQVNKKRAKYAEAKANGSELIGKRFYRINKCLKLSKESFLSWQDICIQFFKWVMDLLKSGKTIQISNKFPNVWDNFLKERSLKEPPIIRSM